MSKKEKEEMELERETFVATRTVGQDDIDTYLSGENWEPMPAYNSNGHFCVDQEYNTDSAGDAKAGDSSDASSYNWSIGIISIF